MPPAISAPGSYNAKTSSHLSFPMSPPRARSALSVSGARGALLVPILLAGVVSLRLAGVSAGVDADLTRLLRAMAVIKTMMAFATTAAIWWRLDSPIGGVRLLAYGAAVAAMAAGPALIWSMTHLAVGAALLHGGLFASLLLLWRDPVVPQRLQSLIARRRHAAATIAERGDH